MHFTRFLAFIGFFVVCVFACKACAIGTGKSRARECVCFDAIASAQRLRVKCDSELAHGTKCQGCGFCMIGFDYMTKLCIFD